MERVESEMRPTKLPVMEAEALWQLRVRRFWGKVLPYLRYVIQSGLGLVIVFGFVSGVALYASFLDRIPPSFPVRELALVLLAPAAAYTTYRTFLEPADLVFLLRMEHQLGAYMKRSVRYSLWPRMLLLVASWCVLWPLYNRADAEPKGFLLSLAVLLLFKAVAAFGAWKERHIVDPKWRLSSRLIRYIWSWGAVACWLWLSIPLAALSSGIAGIVYIAWLLTRRTLHFPWEAHIAAEKVHEGRVYLFLSGFVDMPAAEERRYARPWLKRYGDRFAFTPQAAYRYLLAKTFARSELLGIMLRLNGLGLLLLIWTRDSEWSALLYGLFVFIIGAQLKTLFTYHRHDVWRTIYPIPLNARHKAALDMSTRIHLASAVVLTLPLWFGTTSWSFKLTVLAGGAVIALLSRMKRARARTEDEE